MIAVLPRATNLRINNLENGLTFLILSNVFFRHVSINIGDVVVALIKIQSSRIEVNLEKNP